MNAGSTPPSRVALVTGAGRGIGRAIASTLGDAGLAVGLLGRNPDPIRELAGSLSGPAFAIAADVRKPEMVRRAVDAVTAELGAIDLLVDNAGLRETAAAQPWSADPDDWWDVVEVNVRGPMLLAQAVIPGMLARGAGRVLELASGLGLHAEARFSAYSVSKAAQLRWVDNLAAALGADSPVRVLAASPGLVRTDMTDGMWPDLPDEAYGGVDDICRLAARFAAGHLDPLHGWFVHAAKDDLDTLTKLAGRAGAEARRLRLRAYGDDDPLA